jgi:predicted transport protein
MKNWLIKINNLYNRMLENLNTIDISATKKLYSELEDLSFKINVDNVKVQEKIKRLKISLMNNLIEENFTKIKEIADDIITISSEYK